MLETNRSQPQAAKERGRSRRLLSIAVALPLAVLACEADGPTDSPAPVEKVEQVQKAQVVNVDPGEPGPRPPMATAPRSAGSTCVAPDPAVVQAARQRAERAPKAPPSPHSLPPGLRGRPLAAPVPGAVPLDPLPKPDPVQIARDQRFLAEAARQAQGWSALSPQERQARRAELKQQMLGGR